MNLKCSNCGKNIDSLPTPCGYSISYDDETNEWGCYMKNCGFVAFSRFICDNCCTSG